MDPVSLLHNNKSARDDETIFPYCSIIQDRRTNNDTSREVFFREKRFAKCVCGKVWFFYLYFNYIFMDVQNTSHELSNIEKTNLNISQLSFQTVELS